MGFVDLFRPKHRHSNTATRIEAVRAMTRDDLTLLVQVARTDRDPTVRKVAIEKIDQAETLAELAVGERDEALRDLTSARAGELWLHRACGDDAEVAGAALTGLVRLGQERLIADVAVKAALPAVRRRAMAELHDPKALAELAKKAQNHQTRLEAVARIDDPAVLRALAVDTTNKELGLAAVDRLDDPELLELVATKGKNKAVRQRARKIVAEMQAAEQAARAAAAPAPAPGAPAPASDDDKRRRAEKSQLVRELDGLVESFDFERVGPLVRTAEASYAALSTVASPAKAEAKIDDKFRSLVRRFWKRAELHADGARKAASPAPAPVAEVAPAAPAEVVVAPVIDPEEERKRAARAEEAAARRAERDARKAEDDARRAAEDARREAKRKEQEAQAAELAASFPTVIAEMEAIAAGGDAKKIDRVLEHGRKVFEQVMKAPVPGRDELVARYDAARATLVIQRQGAREAEDWQRYANVPRAEALLKEAMALAESEEEIPDLGGKLKDLQARWKQVGPLPGKASKELWELFKETCDVVYDKVRGQRAVAEAGYAEIAAGKDKLIAEAEALAESTDWQATAERYKQLQAAWKESGRLPRKQDEELWTRFRAACDRFFARRQPLLDAQFAEQEANLAAKVRLCERAEATVAAAPGERGWGAAIGEIRALQDDWRGIGFVPRRDADAIYRRFRAACDGLFAKRDAARDGEADARRAEVDAVVAQLEAVMSASGDDAVGLALEARGALRELAAGDDGQRGPSIELAGLYERMVRHLAAQHADAVRGTAFDPVVIAREHDKLIARAQELVPASPATGPSAAQTAEEMAAALRAAMANNAFSGLRFSGRDPVEVVHELRHSWGQVGPDLGDDGAARRVRFDQACRAALAAAGADDAPAPERPRSDTRSDERRQRRHDRKGEQAEATAASVTATAPAPVATAAPVTAAVPATAHDTVTQPIDYRTLTGTVAPAAAAAAVPEAPVLPPLGALVRDPLPPPPGRGKSLTEPPPMDELDTGWDAADDDGPALPRAPVEDSPPSAGEMAGDGATEGDGIDTGWD
ncbi:MAG: DUF349 domain-containing protein [Kofleriaceae bacterium]|nr:DUF349 domain-containing protein [Kofleriaceae bacterium]